MPAQLEVLKAEMAKSQAGLLRAADAIPAEQWRTSTKAGSWSAAELVAHLTMVERSVVAKADRIAQKEPIPVSFLKRIHLPFALVKARIIKRQSPVPVDPQMLRDKEEMLAGLREARERSLAFLEETHDRDLGGYYWRHPALGMLNTYGWIRFLAAHEVRHTKQMLEIAAGLPKVIDNLQK